MEKIISRSRPQKALKELSKVTVGGDGIQEMSDTGGGHELKLEVVREDIKI